MVKGTKDEILVAIWPWQRSELPKCLEYDACRWIFDGEGAWNVMTISGYLVAKDGYLNEYLNKT